MNNRTLEEVRNNETKLIKEIKQLEDKVKQAIDIAFEYAQIDGAHHKMWVIDQMVRTLLGDDYKKWIEKYMFDGQDPVEAVQNENYFNWDVGITP